jgi:hypothetical protein
MRTVFVATSGVETAPLASGSVIYNLKTARFIMLNPSANLVWSSLSQPHSEQELVDLLRDSYAGLDTPIAQQAVQYSLRELQRLELVAERADEGSASGAPRLAASSQDGGFAPPSVRVLDEEDLLKVFQVTAAEIAVAGCWWAPGCATGNP